MTEISRRDFFKSLAASALAAGAVLPVGLSATGWREITGLQAEQEGLKVSQDRMYFINTDYLFVKWA